MRRQPSSLEETLHCNKRFSEHKTKIRRILVFIVSAKHGVLNLTLKSESAKGIIFSGTVLVLAIAFYGSLLATVGTVGEEWRTVGILEANPNSYIQLTWTVLEYGVLPIAAGIALCIIDLVMQRRTRVRSLSLPLLIAGVFFAVWGLYYSFTAYSSYTQAIGLANRWGVKGIDNSLQIIYVGYEGIGILWLGLGVFLSVASGYVKNTLRHYLGKQ